MQGQMTKRSFRVRGSRDMRDRDRRRNAIAKNPTFGVGLHVVEVVNGSR
jgi:hypothetical protein